MLIRSPMTRSSRSSGAVVFTTGTDSPVKRDSSTSSALAATRRRSAGTRPPDSSRTRSPGTRSRLSTPHSRPSRITRAWGETRCIRARTERSARRSCVKPITAFSASTAPITIASAYSRSRRVTRPASSRMEISGLVNWWRRIAQALVGGASSSWLGPWRSRRAATSARARPRGPAPRRASTSAAASTCHGAGPDRAPPEPDSRSTPVRTVLERSSVTSGSGCGWKRSRAAARSLPMPAVPGRYALSTQSPR
jgi:hypothetical protein